MNPQQQEIRDNIVHITDKIIDLDDLLLAESKDFQSQNLTLLKEALNALRTVQKNLQKKVDEEATLKRKRQCDHHDDVYLLNGRLAGNTAMRWQNNPEFEDCFLTDEPNDVDAGDDYNEGHPYETCMLAPCVARRILKRKI